MKTRSGLAFGLFWLCLLSLLGRADAVSAAESVIKLTSRPGVTMPVLVVSPDGPPVAAAVLLVGGDGKVGLRRRVPGTRRGNFLVRARQSLVDQGVLVAIPDVPSDRRKAGIFDWRDTDQHLGDIAGTVAHLRSLTTGPIWLIGTSRGTISAVHAAARGKPGGIAGIVLTSSVTRPGRRHPLTVMDAALERIALLVLLVHHRNDLCFVTPVEDVERIRRRLTRAPKVAVQLFSGGGPTISEECQAMSAHGYVGIEDEVMAFIAGWIKANPPS